MIPSPPWSVVYADGSANVYRFTARDREVRFGYEPVTPARSSTGSYSGGDPVDATLPVDDARVAALWRWVETLEADRAHHAEGRCKGDGAFTVTTADGARQFLVVRAATRDLEAFLERELRGI